MAAPDRYPSASVYQEALQFPATALHDPELRQAEPETNALGLPRAITGAFAAVFPLERHGRRWALKCFLTDVPDSRQRYVAVAAHLAQADLPYTIAFDYQPRGIQVEARSFPVLKMAWAEGVPLNTFVRQHLDAPATLGALADAWRQLVAGLGAARVAHGDLQHGNVLVRLDGGTPRLTLVDYDTMWVPALKGRPSPEVGHRNYQHPDRTQQTVGPWLDHFSALVIYVALRACSLQPALFERYDTGENLLFSAADFYDPSASPLFADLADLDLADLDAVQPAAEALRTACYLEPEAIPPLADVLEAGMGRNVQARIGAGRRDAEGLLAAAAQARRSRRPRTRFERMALPAGLAVVVLSAGVWAVTSLGWSLTVFAAGLIGWGVAAWWRYRRLPPVRRRRRLRSEQAYFDDLLARLDAQLEGLQEEHRTLHASVDRLRAERLAELQAEALDERLKHHFIGEAAQFDGITHKAVVRLKYAGIRTAAHATPEAVGAVTTLSQTSRTRVNLWRAGLVAQYTEAVPDDLSPAEERRFERYIAHRAGGFADEIGRLREKRVVQAEERRQVVERLEGLHVPSFARYLAFLLRLTTFPTATQRPTPPRPTATTSPPPEQPVAEPAPSSAWWEG